MSRARFVLHSKASPKSSRTCVAPRACTLDRPDEGLDRGGDPDFMTSLAVPVRSAVGVTVAAMNVSAQASRVTRRELIEKALPLLRAAAGRLGGQLPPAR